MKILAATRSSSFLFFFFLIYFLIFLPFSFSTSPPYHAYIVLHNSSRQGRHEENFIGNCQLWRIFVLQVTEVTHGYKMNCAWEECSPALLNSCQKSFFLSFPLWHEWLVLISVWAWVSTFMRSVFGSCCTLIS